ncbi:Cysteinyl-tRNA synthetase [Elusimicrobium minutum Pei191]|uniref:Cysteine--tRNA ligase n=1 Tax=Elusimicrobium minutum (strain Pei191) TaxID=445932 RepID=B2KDW9_ELUMP|nr:cysteine--tRNA ligase [Elusimicrobium minutum]ACC98715.1 Cysteinyl-tRNA synthetase [Elusimicrobium minutum Pei191]
MQLYNSLTKEKEKIVPINVDYATMYACGPTVYNYAHIGNLRTYIFEDILVRALRLEMPVKHVMNVTDVGHLTSDGDSGDDKMELGAAREGKSAWDIAKFYEKKFFEDFDSLNCVRPSVISRATEHIKEMIELVSILEQKGFTYKTSDGIYYDTSKFSHYHDLVGASHISGLKSGARVEFNTEKRNPSDFALWKFSPKDKKRQMEWDSPWGTGFPGWHIECSAMAMKYLGPTIDIHCGGIDHVAIHHTNEIAQSEAATGKQYVRYWVHGEFLVLHAGKMSKSDGTFLTLDALKEKGYKPLDYRYLCLGAHYRTQLEFTFESLDFAKASLKGLRDRAKALKDGVVDEAQVEEFKAKFAAALKDDLNTSKGLAVIWETLKSNAADGTKKEFLKYTEFVFALDLFKVEKEAGVEIPAEVQSLLDERANARKEKDFKKSDELRDKINTLGFIVKDTPQGQKLEAK